MYLPLVLPLLVIGLEKKTKHTTNRTSRKIKHKTNKED